MRDLCGICACAGPSGGEDQIHNLHIREACSTFRAPTLVYSEELQGMVRVEWTQRGHPHRSILGSACVY